MKTLNPPLHRSRINRAFTLIELLIVIGIIAVLAALTMGTFSYAQQQSSRNRTTATLAAITSGLERYKAENGEYPQPASPDKTADVGSAKGINVGGALMLYQALTGDGDTEIELATHSAGQSDGTVSVEEQPKTINGDFVPVKDSSTNVWRSKLGATLVTQAGFMIVDGFGHPFFYQKNVDGSTAGVINPTYDVWSVAQSSIENVLSVDKKTDRARTGVWIKNW